MNTIEKQYFEELRALHLKLSEALRDPRLSGVNDVIGNLYRDDAHFVCELLQNADDRGATYAIFRLQDDGLIFIHNAPRHFTITNPSSHEEDRKAGKLGDVNSILSIASSSKTGKLEEVPIGKFGLGFKSVFLYTDQPKIYDDNFRFSISHYIVPDLIDSDHPLRTKHETLFHLPFKPGERKTAYAEIQEKLRSLVNPLLFLKHLKKIEWETENSSGFYRLEELEKPESGTKLHYEIASDGKCEHTELWKFEKPIDDSPGLSVAVVYTLDKDSKKIHTARRHPLYCYLPTANETDLPVILHAPFRLTGNRESIIARDPHNTAMITMLASLLARSLQEICKIGEQNNTPWIDDNILRFIPQNGRFQYEGTAAALNLQPLTESVVHSIRSGKMLWCEQLGRYLDNRSGYIPDNSYLSDIYPSRLLSQILNEDCGWVLPSLTAEIKKDGETAKLLEVERVTPEKILRKITSEILAGQSVDWLKQWYLSLKNVRNLWKNGQDPFLRYKKIILTSEGTFEAPFTKGQIAPNVHLPKSDCNTPRPGNIYIVESSLLDAEDLHSFFIDLGLKETDDFTLAERVYLPQVISEDSEFSARLKALAHFAAIYCKKLTVEERQTLHGKCLFPAYSASGPAFVTRNEIKLHNDVNDFYYKGNDQTRFYEPSRLSPHISPGEIDAITAMILEIPEARKPSVKVEIIPVTSSNESRIPHDARTPAWYNRKKPDFEYFEEPIVIGLKHFVNSVAALSPKEASGLIETIIAPRYLKARYRSLYGGTWHSAETEPMYFSLLANAPWIELATPALKKLLGLPVKELQQEEIDIINSVFSSSGITGRTDVENLLDFLQRENILKRFQQRQSIERQKEILRATRQFTLQWLDEILNLRLRYVEAKEKTDIEFLIKALKQAILTVQKDTEADLRQMLPAGINILFGPPGTGKTTEITEIVAKQTERNPDCRILILTPTNAAANVAAHRINKRGGSAYRGINPSDEALRSNLDELGIPVYDAATDDIRSVTIATVHYFSRAYSSAEQNYLHELRWDTVIIDETSMVTLDYVLLTLYKAHQNNPHCKFYIVGDPLQLPAITNLDPFILEDAQLDEFNFFSFIGLKEFSDNPADIPEIVRPKVNITLLTHQYRSVRPLCEITSHFAYGGKILSARKDTPVVMPQRALPIFTRPLSFVRFPVTSCGTTPLITDLDKLGSSNFNIYSALIVKESLQHLFSRLREAGFAKPLKIGIITPYTAQKYLIEKLLNTNPISRSINVEVCVNTVHQFQGDEFEIVMLVLNPPNKTMTPRDGILINKRYLINVATSRAKDCLVILYPDESCVVKNFSHINHSGEALNIESIARKIFHSDISELTVSAADIERELFGSPDFLANNCEVDFHEEINLHEHTRRYIYKFIKGGNTIDILYSPPSIPHYSP